ncbi:sialic acid synthase [Drosophila grimshawi]|uniref:N-acetylneuraminate-9-phosphate synthase n=1 Tax=Drosophila grimshawi TaxID=7222 RepID=B4JTP3_DROGR|nr:sialic acid synthase [Drosophila grimshawi]EDV91472.1 GH13892 [Drosophila grimshawi]
MLLLDIMSKKICNEVYIIAEIGQNHQGCPETAKRMILEAKKAGCHCVKFQKSDLAAKFTSSALNRKYVSDHAWGSTYGQHKEYLEFSKEVYHLLQDYSREIGIDFTASAMDERSLEFLADLRVPFIKIGSGDANNFPLLTKAASLQIPLVISTGMQTMSTVDKIVEIMSESRNEMYALMHCISAYPTPPTDCNLGLISVLMRRFPNVTIGYSGHELGVSITKAAVLMGARIVERHFTLDKNQKGSDHRCSLEPAEMCSLVRGIDQFRHNKYLLNANYTVEEIIKMLGGGDELRAALSEVENKDILECELPCRFKLGKSIVAARDLDKGHKIQVSDLTIKVSEPSGISAETYFDIIGMQLTRSVNQDEPIIENVLTS